MATPNVSRMDDGSLFCVVLLEEGGQVLFTFDNIEQFKFDTVNAGVSASMSIPGSGTLPSKFEGRLNLLSLSSRESFARQMAKAFSVKFPAEIVLSTAISAVLDYVRGVDDSDWIENIAPESAEMLFEPFLVRGAPNLLFGKGEGAKTFTALRMALSLATGQPFLGFVPKHRVNTLFVDYEDIGAVASDRIHKLCSGPSLKGMNLEDLHQKIRYFNPRGIAIPDILPALKRAIHKHNIEFVLIDSAVFACGGEPEKAEPTARYFNALKSLGVTTLTIAHETKSEDHKYPFGSVYWFNSPRSIWNVRAIHEEDEPKEGATVLETALFHKKANNGPRHPFVPLRVEFGDGMVEVSRGDLASWQNELSIPTRIKKLLTLRPYTTEELCEELPDLDKAVVKVTLSRMRGKTLIDQLGTRGSPWKITGQF